MPRFSYGILSIILLSLYMVFLSTVIFHKYTYMNHFPLLVNFSFLYKTIIAYSHFLLSKINYSSPLHEDMPYLWFGGGLGRFRTKYFSAFIFLWQNCLSLTNVKVFSGYSMKHVFTKKQSNQSIWRIWWKTIRRIWIMVQMMVWMRYCGIIAWMIKICQPNFVFENSFILYGCFDLKISFVIILLLASFYLNTRENNFSF